MQTRDALVAHDLTNHSHVPLDAHPCSPQSARSKTVGSHLVRSESAHRYARSTHRNSQNMMWAAQMVNMCESPQLRENVLAGLQIGLRGVGLNYKERQLSN